MTECGLTLVLVVGVDMKIWRVAMALLLWVGMQSSAVANTAQPVVDAQTLSALLSVPKVKVIDIRSADFYAAGHIPTAVSAPYGKWRGPAHSPGQLADSQYLQQLVRDLGIAQDEHVIVYSSGDSQTDFGAAARVYWTLKYVGLTHLSVLDGGYQQWQKAGFATESTAPKIQSSDFTAQINSSVVIFKDELLAKVTSQDPQAQIIDARPEAFYEGKVKAPTASTPGTIAGAKNAQHQQWFNANSTTLKPAQEILQLVQQQGLDQAAETVSFCNTGHWAATNWFVLSEVAKLKNVRLYPSSLAEWTQAEQALPMENTPSRGDQILNKFQQLIKK